jgi:hypothetical protein
MVRQGSGFVTLPRNWFEPSHCRLSTTLVSRSEKAQYSSSRSTDGCPSGNPTGADLLRQIRPLPDYPRARIRNLSPLATGFAIASQ